MQYSCSPPSSVFRQVFTIKCFPSSVFRQAFSVVCFPSNVFRQVLSVRCVPSGGFRQVFSAKCFPSNVRHFLDGGVFRSIGNYICLLCFYMFYISFYKFSTEELRLATGAIRRLSLATKKACVAIYKGNREGNVHCFYGFSAKFCLPHPPFH